MVIFPAIFQFSKCPHGPWFRMSRRSRLEQILTKSLKKEKAQKISPVKCTIPNSIRAKNPRRGLLGLRIFSANLQRENGDFFSVSISFAILGGHRSKSKSESLWVRPSGDKTTFFLTLVLCSATQVDLG